MSDASKKDSELMKKIVSHCKSRGFIFQCGEIYGGLNGCWDYGPIGVELKRNLKEVWWRRNVTGRDDIVGMDGSILTLEAVLKASGHLDGFEDEMSTCKSCKKHIRFDQLREMVAESEWAQSLAEVMPVTTTGETAGVTVCGETLLKWARKKGKKLCPNLALVKDPEITLSWIAEEAERHQPMDPWYFYQLAATAQFKQTGLINPCPNCGGELTTPRKFNLMFETNFGAAGDSTVYLRPETAQTIFVQFKNVADTSRVKLPFGIAQIGKSFRNEINPRNYTFRSREFEQMEIEFFCHPDDGMALTDEWLENRLCFYEDIGIPRDHLHVLDVPDGERAHYSKKTYDIKYEFPFGIQELEGVAYRTDHDLHAHQDASGKSLEYFDDQKKEKFIPHVVEPSAGCDRTVLALICEAYDEETITDAKGKKETRIVMHFDPKIAPIKAAILPLLKNKPALVEKAREVQKLLQPFMNVYYDDGGAIGRRYRRQDELGTPYCFTIDFETLGEEAPDLKDTVTVRDRDSMKQSRMPIAELLQFLTSKIH